MFVYRSAYMFPKALYCFSSRFLLKHLTGTCHKPFAFTPGSKVDFSQKNQDGRAKLRMENHLAGESDICCGMVYLLMFTEKCSLASQEL